MAKITQLGPVLSRKKAQPRAFRVVTDFVLDTSKKWKVTIVDLNGNDTWAGFIIPDDVSSPMAGNVYAVRTKGTVNTGLGAEETGQISVVITDGSTTTSDALIVSPIFEA
jgi:hypothetical protein